MTRRGVSERFSLRTPRFWFLGASLGGFLPRVGRRLAATGVSPLLISGVGGGRFCYFLSLFFGIYLTSRRRFAKITSNGGDVKSRRDRWKVGNVEK
jgi:hypothetical protein